MSLFARCLGQRCSAATSALDKLARHVDRINDVTSVIHLIDNVFGLQCDGLKTHQSTFTMSKSGHLTSMVTLNFLARSLMVSDRARPVIIPFMCESASGERLPGSTVT